MYIVDVSGILPQAIRNGSTHPASRSEKLSLTYLSNTCCLRYAGHNQVYTPSTCNLLIGECTLCNSSQRRDLKEKYSRLLLPEKKNAICINPAELIESCYLLSRSLQKCVSPHMK